MLNISVEKIKNQNGLSQPLSFSAVVDPSEYGFTFRLDGPVSFEGEIINHSGNEVILTIKGALKANLALVCDRCAQPFSLSVEDIFEEDYSPAKDIAVADEEGEKDIHLFSGDQIDIAPEILQQLFLMLPMKALCAPDCKGLCPVCGINLNFDQCSCETVDIDPRLEKLKDFVFEGSKKGV